MTVAAEAEVLSRVEHPLDGGLTGEGVVGPLRGTVEAARVRNAWYAPAFGAVFNRRGQVFKTAVSEALHLTPTLAALPRARREGDTTLFQPPADAPRLARATVFVTWGGLHNYSHFLLDCLPALQAVRDAGALDRFPAIAPPLLPWQSELLRLMLGAEAPAPIEVAAPLARLDEVVFASPMDRFLRAPGPPLDAVRANILANAAIADEPASPRRIYVSRRGSMRAALVNESELETALAARGFTIVRPETLSVREHIVLFHRAEMIIGLAGAALANVLFCRPGAEVIELQPSNIAGAWVRDIAALGGVDWRAFIAPSPLVETEILMEGALRPALAFSWRLDLEVFLAFLDRSR